MLCINNQEHGWAIAALAGCPYNPARNPVISRAEGGELVGGAIMQDYTKRTISLHVAGFRPMWLNRELLKAVCGYAFTQLKCEQMLAGIRSGNSEALSFARKAGFCPVARVPDVYPDGDLVIMSMRREHCRWLP